MSLQLYHIYLYIFGQVITVELVAMAVATWQKLIPLCYKLRYHTRLEAKLFSRPFLRLFSAFLWKAADPNLRSYCCGLREHCGLNIVVKTRYFSSVESQNDQRFCRASNSDICFESVHMWWCRTFQEYPPGRDDLKESYFHLGLEYTDMLLFLVFSHGMNLSLNS